MFYNQYIKFIKNELPYEKFCELFKANKEVFLEEYYSDFIDGTMEDGLANMQYQDFLNCCPFPAFAISEDEYYEVLKTLEELRLVSHEEFLEKYCNYEDYDEEDEEDGDYEDYDEEEEDY